MEKKMMMMRCYCEGLCGDDGVVVDYCISLLLGIAGWTTMSSVEGWMGVHGIVRKAAQIEHSQRKRQQWNRYWGDCHESLYGAASKGTAGTDIGEIATKACVVQQARGR